MEGALCFGCVEDSYLGKIIRDEGSTLACLVCGESEREAITVQQLGQIMEPIMREHFELGPQVRKFGDDDKDWWEQEGESISGAVQEVLGQYFDFEDDIVEAIIEAEGHWPPDGDEPYWDTANSYVSTRVQTGHYFAEWERTLVELKHSRRFFSPAARALFEELFDGIDELRASGGRLQLPVARVLPQGTSIFRARACNSRGALKGMRTNPMKELGPPPPAVARAGRMNADGIVVLYAASEAETCFAEMRPALGIEIGIIEMKTTAALRILDFSLLEKAYTGTALSYFQPDFTEQVERRAFLRRLHKLISQPIVPGKEADYLITQTMAEYLAHVHVKPFDGVQFFSVQRAEGVNIVLFPRSQPLADNAADGFQVEYVNDSFRLFRTTEIRYTHHELEVTPEGELWADGGLDVDPGDDWE